MDQSQNNKPDETKPATPTPTAAEMPPTPATPTQPVPPPASDVPAAVAPEVKPMTMTPEPAVPADIPPAAQGSTPPMPEESNGSPLKKILILAVALIIAFALLYAGYTYMNNQAGSSETSTIPTPADAQVPAGQAVSPSATSAQEEKQIDNLDVGSDEAEIKEIETDVNGL